MLARGIPAIVVLVGLAVAIDAGLSTVTSYAPNLVLLVVVATGFAGGASYGAATGFGTGLLLDLAPYSASVVGTGALAFTVAGFLAGAANSAWKPSNRLLRLLRPVVLVAGGAVVVALVFGCSTVLFDQSRFGLTGMTELLRNSALPTILLAPVVLPGLVALLGRRP